MHHDGGASAQLARPGGGPAGAGDCACSLVVVAFAGAAVPVVRWRMEPPRHEPRFEGTVDEAPGPVKEFAFRDIHGHRTRSRTGSIGRESC